jgi:long-chain acyl-CoA synthetase
MRGDIPRDEQECAQVASKAYVWSPWRSAYVDPDRVAVATDDGDRVTYAELVDHADRIGGALRAMGVPDGARISTDLRAGPEFFALALAALKFGFGLFPVNAASLGPATAERLRRDARTTLHVSDERGPIGGEVLAYRELVAHSRPDSATGPGTFEGHLILATSGTTADEHDVVSRPRPHHAYRGVAVFAKYSAGRDFGPHVMGNPTFHLGTLGPALYALQAGSGVVVSHHWSPEGMEALVREHAASSAFLSVDLLTEYAFSKGHGGRLSKLFHGGSACAPWVKRKAIDVHGPILHEYYGTSEGVVSEISTEEWMRRPGSVGRPFAGVDVVVERDGRPAPTCTPGEIIVRARPDDAGDRALLATGDLGYLDDDGYLYVLGRMTHAGRSAEAMIEHNVRSMAGVSDVVAIDDSGVTCLVEVVDGGSADWIPRISAVVDNAGSHLREVLMFASGTLARTDSGKISRVAAKRLVASRQNQPTGVAGRHDG